MRNNPPFFFGPGAFLCNLTIDFFIKVVYNNYSKAERRYINDKRKTVKKTS